MQRPEQTSPTAAGNAAAINQLSKHAGSCMMHPCDLTENVAPPVLKVTLLNWSASTGSMQAPATCLTKCSIHVGA